MHTSWLVCFAVAAVTQLVFVIAHAPGPLAFIVTALTMPLLAVWVGRARGPRLLVLAVLYLLGVFLIALGITNRRHKMERSTGF